MVLLTASEALSWEGAALSYMGATEAWVGSGWPQLGSGALPRIDAKCCVLIREINF